MITLHLPLLWIFLHTWLCSSAAATSCDITPLVLPWRNVSVTSDGLAITRGIEVGIGTPNQIFSFRPTTKSNNTRIFSKYNCGNSTGDASYVACVGGNGGIFDSAKSSTFSVSITQQWNGSLVDIEQQIAPATSYVFFNDDIAFDRKGNVMGYPSILDTQVGEGAQAGLPFGVDSTFANAVYKARLAPDRSWGLWPGSRSHQPVDGAIVIGGYDRARLASNFTDFPLEQISPSAGCPLQVTVSNVNYNLPNGTTFNLMPSNLSTGFVACIEPFQQRFTLPLAARQLFEQYTSHDPSFHSGLTYSLANAPTGNISVVLDNGYTSTIPNQELVTKFRGSDEYGRFSILNDSVVDVGIAFLNNSNVVPILGGLFLSMNYLYVDYDHGLFKLAAAKQGDQKDGSEDLVYICSNRKDKSKTGIIVGSVVGGLAVILLVAGTLFYLHKRQRRRQQQPDLPPPPLTVIPEFLGESFKGHELPSPTIQQELPTPPPFSPMSPLSPTGISELDSGYQTTKPVMSELASDYMGKTR